MAMLTQVYRINPARIAFIQKWDDFIEKPIPCRCMVVLVGLILAGLSIPLLMAVQLLPISLVLGFVGFALVVISGVMALIFCGELLMPDPPILYKKLESFRFAFATRRSSTRVEIPSLLNHLAAV
jgi:hypothetical protein